jgi:hypothetical protein
VPVEAWPADRIARLCVRLTETDGPLARDGGPRAKADEIVAAMRAGADESRLGELLSQLDDALRAAGYAAGLGQYRTGAAESDLAFGRIHGLDEHPVEELLVCPGERQCRRAELPTWDLVRPDPLCTVYSRSLRPQQVHP